jgi:hypothetical protein
MQVSQETNKSRGKEPGKLFKIILFWTIFLFIIFLSKRLIGYPKSNLEFIVINSLLFVCTVILSGAMLHFFSVKSLKLSIPIIWLLTVIFAVL